MLLQQNSKLLIKICLVALLQNALNVNGEFYSSVHEMSKLVQYESTFLQHMQNFIDENESKLEFLKARLAEFEMERDEALETGEETYFDSPVNRYLLTKRLTVDWERIGNLLETNAGEKPLIAMDKYRTDTNLPTDADLEGAIEGFLRLQETYRLSTKDMAAGILQGVKYATALEARHCFDIAKQAATQNKQKLAHSWLMEAWHRMQNDNGPNYELLQEAPDETDILMGLLDTKHKLGDIKGANESYVHLLALQPDNERLVQGYMVFYLETADKESLDVDYSQEHEPIPENLLQTDQFARFKYTCSGHIAQTPSEERHLRCGYLTETHPFLLLAPLKVEELNLDPLLVVYHDVISDSEIAVIKNLTENKIQRATVLSDNGSIVSPVRTSQFTFMPKTVHRVLQDIDVRVEDMTNLNMTYAEDHQFANYGIGGHYAQHVDWFSKEHLAAQTYSKEMGNRIATVLFYLTDVAQGGATAFPYMKRLLLPKKGAAAFWHNLHASGEGDERSMHGACPIIVGSKWVQNRWIREFIQSDRRPCELYNDKVEGPY